MNWHRYFDALVRGERWAIRALLFWVAVVIIGIGLSIILR